MTIRKYITPLLVAAGIGLTAPANAAIAIFNFGGNSGGLNTAVNPDVYALTSTGLTVTVRAYGNIFGTVDYSNPTDVNWAASGLGASGNGNSDINSNGGLIFGGAGEGLLLTFSQSVELTQALFGNFDGSGFLPDDVDFEWGSPISVGETLDPLTGVSNSGTWNGSLTGTQFFFAAKGGGGFDGDSFRLNGVTANFTPAAPAVPEPATWAMMLIGFGAIGLGLRRRQPVKTTVTYA